MSDVVFDKEGALDRVDGDQDLLIELFDIAFTDMERRLIVIKEAINSQNGKMLADTAHAVKSALGNIGAVSCHGLAASLERKGKQNSFDDVPAILSEFEKQLALFKRIAESFQSFPKA